MGMDFNETERVFSITEYTDLSYAALSFPILQKCMSSHFTTDKRAPPPTPFHFFLYK
jgi:hypothetical protein